MSFILASQLRDKKLNANNDEDQTTHCQKEDEIQNRIQHELDIFRQKIIADAKADATASAFAELTPLKQKLERALSSISEINDQLKNPLAQKEKYLADLAIEVAFKVASQIIGAHVLQDKEPLLNLVSGLLNDVKSEHGLNHGIIIHLSPLDLPFIQSNLSETNITLVEDSNIEPGGAVLELPSSGEDFLDKTIWDAQLKSRFENLQKIISLPQQVTLE